MHGPPLAGWLLVALGAATGTYCLAHWLTAPAGARWGAGSEALLGWGMALMAVPAGVLDQHPWGPPLYAVVFGAAGAGALLPVCRGRPRRSRPHHVVEAWTMAYMGAAMLQGSGAGHAGHPGHPSAAGLPLLTGALLLYFTGYALRSGVRLVPVAATGADSAAWPRRPELTDACRLAMATGMCAMLLTL
ncbi:DUF5134 domain-containing protein [Streptomyces palmae]|uniref:DUF5134 domain-containing protein n=1 Tax=Streptomyces palmae TaxID=1701085 RepID=A0A4Z0HGE2_9ACTN|nr:DUF5134 domain-containing protein [Streptomyces palmae]TGB18281.1 DUF5134 domain-containing protein [Streptomyces palmae]